jgi:hypothetical protein
MLGVLRVLSSTRAQSKLLMAFMILAITNLPLVLAFPEQGLFPDISFKLFSQFVEKEFSSDISLTTVLVVLFSLTENSELLNLHARQQNPASPGEKRLKSTGWIQALAHAMQNRLGKEYLTLFSINLKRTDTSGK